MVYKWVASYETRQTRGSDVIRESSAIAGDLACTRSIKNFFLMDNYAP